MKAAISSWRTWMNSQPLLERAEQPVDAVTRVTEHGLDAPLAHAFPEEIADGLAHGGSSRRWALQRDAVRPRQAHPGRSRCVSSGDRRDEKRFVGLTTQRRSGSLREAGWVRQCAASG